MLSSALQFLNERRKRFHRSDTAPTFPSGSRGSDAGTSSILDDIVADAGNSGRESPSTAGVNVLSKTPSQIQVEDTASDFEQFPGSRKGSAGNLLDAQTPTSNPNSRKASVVTAPVLVISPPNPLEEPKKKTSASYFRRQSATSATSGPFLPLPIPTAVPSTGSPDPSGSLLSASSSPGSSGLDMMFPVASSSSPGTTSLNPTTTSSTPQHAMSDMAYSSSLEDISSLSMIEGASSISSDMLSHQLSLGSIDEPTISPTSCTSNVNAAFPQQFMSLGAKFLPLKGSSSSSTTPAPKTPTSNSRAAHRRKLLSRRRGSQSASIDSNGRNNSNGLDSPISSMGRSAWHHVFNPKSTARSMEDIIREEKLFWMAIRREDCETVKSILQQHGKGELVNRVNPFGLQPLDLVCMLGQETLLMVLLEFGAVNNPAFFGHRDISGKERLSQHLNHCVQELAEQLLRYQEALSFSPQQEKIQEEMSAIEEQHCLLCNARYGLQALPLPPEPPTAVVEVVSAECLQVLVRAPPTEFMVTRYLIQWTLVHSSAEDAALEAKSPTDETLDSDSRSTIVAAHYPQGLYELTKLATNCTYAVRVFSWNLSGYSQEARPCRPPQVRLTTWFNQTEHVDRTCTAEGHVPELNAMQNEIQQELCLWLTSDYHAGAHNDKFATSGVTGYKGSSESSLAPAATSSSSSGHIFSISALRPRSPHYGGSSAQRKRRLLQLLNLGGSTLTGGGGSNPNNSGSNSGSGASIAFPFKYTRHVKRGLYIALIYSCLDKMLLYDDALPLLKVDTSNDNVLLTTPAGAQSDALWLMRLLSSKVNLKILAQNLLQLYTEVPTGIQQRVKLLLAMYQIQSTLCPTTFSVGELLPHVILRDNACVLLLVHQLQHAKDISLSGSGGASPLATGLKWTSGTKLTRRIQACLSGLDMEHLCVTRNTSTSGMNPTMSSAISATSLTGSSGPSLLAAVSAEEELYSHLDEIIRKHPRKVADRLNPGLYVAYLRLRLFHDQLQILHSESHHNILPAWLIRENNHVTMEEWATLKSLTGGSSILEEQPQDGDFIKSVHASWKKLSEALRLSEEEREKSRLYLGELFPVDRNVTLLVVTAPVEDVCLHQAAPVTWDAREFVFMHFAVFEHWLFYTYDHAFYSLCTTLKSILELLIPLALKCQRQNFNDDPDAIRQHKRRVDLFSKFQQRLEEIWTSKRWTKDIIVRSRSTKPEVADGGGHWLPINVLSHFTREATRNNPSPSTDMKPRNMVEEILVKCNRITPLRAEMIQEVEENLHETPTEPSETKLEDKNSIIHPSTEEPGLPPPAELAPSKPALSEPTPSEPTPFESDQLKQSQSEPEPVKLSKSESVPSPPPPELPSCPPRLPVIREKPVDEEPSSPTPTSGVNTPPRLVLPPSPSTSPEADVQTTEHHEVLKSPSVATAPLATKLGNKFLRGSLIIHAGYACGLPEGTSVKLQITSRTTTREIINLVVRKLWQIRHSFSQQQTTQQLRDEEMETYFLVVCLENTERPLRENFHPLLLQPPWNQGKLVVRGTGPADA